jgi:hypothetical protein
LPISRTISWASSSRCVVIRSKPPRRISARSRGAREAQSSAAAAAASTAAIPSSGPHDWTDWMKDPSAGSSTENVRRSVAMTMARD